MAKSAGQRKRRHRRGADGYFLINGKKFMDLIGTRAKVYHGTAYKTTGGLKRDDLMKNKQGRIVSKKVSARAKRERRLEKAGFKPTKGKFKLFSKRRGGAKGGAKGAWSI